MKTPISQVVCGIISAVTLAAGLTGTGLAQEDASPRLDHNQTIGFGANKLLIFGYEQNLFCIDQP